MSPQSAHTSNLLDLPAEVIQQVLSNMDNDELRRLVREVEELAGHSLEAIKVRFRKGNTWTFPDAASYQESLRKPIANHMDGSHYPSDAIEPDNSIFWVIENNESRVLMALIDAGLDPLSICKGGWRPLGVALTMRNDKMAALFIDRMDPVSLLQSARVCPAPSNFLTLGTGYSIDIFRQMWLRVRHLSNWADHFVPSARYELCKICTAAFADELLADGVDLSKAVLQKQGKTAWHAAAQANNNIDFYDWLYARIPGQINQASRTDGRTPLLLVVNELFRNRYRVTQWMIAHGAVDEAM